MIKSFFENKKIMAVFAVVFIFLLSMIVFVVFKSSNKMTVKKQLSPEEIKLVTDAGNFLNDGVRQIDSSDIVLGKKNAKVRLIVYEDLSSYYSAEFDKTLDRIKKDFGDKVAIAFRPYANKMFPFSISANLWSQCANDQGKFFEARDLLLEKTESESFSEDYLLEYNKAVGLNSELMDACLRDEKYLPKLEKMKIEAEKFDVYGVPTVFVGNEMVVGSRSFEDTVNSEGEKIEGMKNIVYRHLN